MSEIPFARPIIEREERDAVMEVLEGPILVHGPRATGFEDAFAAYCDAPHAISVSSCTAGMHLFYFAQGLGPGDEVIVPAQTHVATAHAVALTGATPVFVDAKPDTGNIDLAALEDAITERTRGIAVVHYLGVPVDVPRVTEIAKRHDLFVLEDCALAIGSRLNGTHAGLFGDVGVFSFYPVKHMTTAEGGMIITRDAALAERLRLRKAFGVDRTHGERAVPGHYDAVALGFNYRMNELQAAIGIEQVKKLDRFLGQRSRNYEALLGTLTEIEGISLFRPPAAPYENSHYCLSIMLDEDLVDRRPEIMSGMKAKGVGTSIYYPRPVPYMTYYRQSLGAAEGLFPVATHISDSSVALPVGPHLNEEDMGTVAKALATSIRKVR